jgi:hypothetical protein
MYIGSTVRLKLQQETSRNYPGERLFKSPPMFSTIFKGHPIRTVLRIQTLTASTQRAKHFFHIKIKENKTTGRGVDM